MNSKELILKALKRDEKERGLRIVSPENYMIEGHIKKSDHNLIVMTDLEKLGHEDWVVITAYYAMYQSAIGLLAKIGLESKDHATTVAVLDYFFGSRLSRDLIKKFDDVKKRKDKIEAIIIGEKYIDYLWKIKRARETVQYGISTNYRETNNVMNNARAFVSKIKLVIDGLDEELTEDITKKVEELKKESVSNQ